MSINVRRPLRGDREVFHGAGQFFGRFEQQRELRRDLGAAVAIVPEQRLGDRTAQRCPPCRREPRV